MIYDVRKLIVIRHYSYEKDGKYWQNQWMTALKKRIHTLEKFVLEFHFIIVFYNNRVPFKI